MSFSAKHNLYELVIGGRNGLDGGGVTQFNFTRPGFSYQVSSSSGSSVTLTCPAMTNGCISLVVYKSTGGVWFSSAWGPAISTAGEQPQTIEKTIAAGMTYIS